MAEFFNPVIYYNGEIYHIKPRFYPDAPAYGSYMGGPLLNFYKKIDASKVELGQYPLYRVMTLHSDIISDLVLKNQYPLPIYFGMKHSGSAIEYTVDAGSAQITDFNYQSDDPDWPYADYPPIFPYWQIEVSHKEPCEFSTFEENYTWQGLLGDPYNLVVVIPNTGIPGCSLWGPESADVLIVAEINLTTGEVIVQNQID